MKHHPFEELSFVARRTKGGFHFWNILPPEGYGEACWYGSRLAVETLRMMTRLQDNHLLQCIVKDQASAADLPGHHGARVGFWLEIAQFILTTAPSVNIHRYAKWVDEREACSKAQAEQDRAQIAKERSERGRIAANARWAKHKKAA